jgi:hypothetical protein
MDRAACSPQDDLVQGAADTAAAAAASPAAAGTASRGAAPCRVAAYEPAATAAGAVRPAAPAGVDRSTADVRRQREPLPRIGQRSAAPVDVRPGHRSDRPLHRRLAAPPSGSRAAQPASARSDDERRAALLSAAASSASSASVLRCAGAGSAARRARVSVVWLAQAALVFRQAPLVLPAVPEPARRSAEAEPAVAAAALAWQRPERQSPVPAASSLQVRPLRRAAPAAPGAAAQRQVPSSDLWS